MVTDNACLPPLAIAPVNDMSVKQASFKAACLAANPSRLFHNSFAGQHLCIGVLAAVVEGPAGVRLLLNMR